VPLSTFQATNAVLATPFQLLHSFCTPSFHFLQVFLASHTRRQPDAHTAALVSPSSNVNSICPLTLVILPPFHNFVDSALLKTKCRTNPYSATALHALPCITSYLSVAFRIRTLETAIQEPLFESWPHPGQRVEEMVRTDGMKRGWGQRVGK
jgi:hypothetical protein